MEYVIYHDDFLYSNLSNHLPHVQRECVDQPENTVGQCNRYPSVRGYFTVFSPLNCVEEGSAVGARTSCQLNGL